MRVLLAVGGLALLYIGNTGPSADNIGAYILTLTGTYLTFKGLT